LTITVEEDKLLEYYEFFCKMHGRRDGVPVSPGVLRALEENKPDNVVFLVMLLKGEAKKEDFHKEFYTLLDELDIIAEELPFHEELVEDAISSIYYSRMYYVKKEELGAPPLTGKLVKHENKYEYLMIFEDKASVDRAVDMMNMACPRCFGKVAYSVPEIIYPFCPDIEISEW
jgi:hypothetical protein